MSDRLGAPPRTLDERDAFDAMFVFLEAYWERGGRTSDDLAVLLGSLNLAGDGMPMDPAQWSDWRAAVDKVTGSARYPDHISTLRVFASSRLRVRQRSPSVLLRADPSPRLRASA